MAGQEQSRLKNRFSAFDDPDERSWQLREFFTALLVAALFHTALDAHFTTLIPDALSKHPGSPAALSPSSTPPEIETLTTEGILRRLPSLPQRLFA